MNTFTVIYVKGRSRGKGYFAQFEPLGDEIRHVVETSNRAFAYVKTYEHLAKLGMGIFAMAGTGDGNPLDFTAAERKFVEDSGIPFDSRPRSGFRIEKIIKEK